MSDNAIAAGGARRSAAAWLLERMDAWLPGQRERVARRFAANTDTNLFLGVFDSFDAAAASAPSTLPLGYDNEDSAVLYLKRLRVDEFDYPALFWVAQSLHDGMRSIIDIGGAVGIKYYAFGRFLAFPPDLRWRVIEVPAVVERGRAFAVERKSPPGLEFEESLASIDGFDVIFASGSLQYLPKSLSQILGSLRVLPRRIIINTTPIHPTASFFTLNSVGTAFCPYRVDDREKFVNEIAVMGYRLRDEWQNKGKTMAIPFHADLSLDDYTGFCFDRS